ncbi:MAG: hypothetical protein AAFR42_14435 [Cyanobacteria bacterium J06628_6]
MSYRHPQQPPGRKVVRVYVQATTQDPKALTFIKGLPRSFFLGAVAVALSVPIAAAFEGVRPRPATRPYIQTCGVALKWMHIKDSSLEFEGYNAANEMFWEARAGEVERGYQIEVNVEIEYQEEWRGYRELYFGCKHAMQKWNESRECKILAVACAPLKGPQHELGQLVPESQKAQIQ